MGKRRKSRPANVEKSVIGTQALDTGGRLQPASPSPRSILPEEEKDGLGLKIARLFKPGIDISKFATSELKKAHELIHKMYDGEKVEIEQSLDTKELTDLHAMLVDELNKRQEKHPRLYNALDDFSEDFEQSKKNWAKVQKEISVQGQSVVKLDEVLKRFKAFKVRSPLINLVGEIVEKGETTGPIEVHVQGVEDIAKDFKDAIAHHLIQTLPDLEDRTVIKFDSAIADTDRIELFDLGFDRIDSQTLLEKRVAEDANLGVFGSPGGKARFAKNIAVILPEHKTYVEPFAGAASVFFAKERAATEALNDIDPLISKCFQLLKTVTEKEIEQLKRKDWIGSAAKYYKMKKISEPKNKIDWLHWFLYRTLCAFGSDRSGGFNYAKTDGKNVAGKKLERINWVSKRLKGVMIHNEDWQKTMERYDTKDTLFFLDPPYVGYDASLGEKKFKEEDFCKFLENMKGKFLMTYGARGKLPGLLRKAGFHIKRKGLPRTGLGNQTTANETAVRTLFVTNYEPEKQFKIKGVDIVKELGLISVYPETMHDLAVAEPRSAYASAVEQANRSERANEVKPGEFVFQPRSIRSCFPEEKQTVERFVSMFTGRNDLFPVVVQKKIDGVRHQIHRMGDDVRIFTEKGAKVDRRYPNICKAIRQLPVEKLIIDVVIDNWIGRQHLPKETVLGYLDSYYDDDSGMVANVVDVLFFDKDIHKEPLAERIEYLSKLGIEQETEGVPKLKDKLNVVPMHKAEGVGQLERLARDLRSLPSSKGVIAKAISSSYSLSGKAKDWIKFQNTSLIRATVYERLAVGNSWVYLFGVKPGKDEPVRMIEKVVPVGETLPTRLFFDEGDTVLIETDSVTYERSPLGTRAVVWKPKVLSQWDGKQDTIDTMTDRARKNFVLKMRVIDKDGRSKYLRSSIEKGKFTIHHHWVGKSLCSEIRIGSDDKPVIEWILKTQKEPFSLPVSRLSTARMIAKNKMESLSEVNWNTGKWNGSVSDVKKSIAPHKWLSVEGVTKIVKGRSIGGTEKHPGVFQIVDSGEVEFGAQTPLMNEYFIKGENNRYRLVFKRDLERTKGISRSKCMHKECASQPEVDVLWAGGRGRAWFCRKHLKEWKDGFEKRGKQDWLEIVGEKGVPSGEVPAKWSDVHKGIELVSIDDKAIATRNTLLSFSAHRETDPMPYVLSKSAVKAGWLPPTGASALPESVRKQVPDDLRYWESSDPKTKRDRLVKAIDKNEAKIDFDLPFKQKPVAKREQEREQVFEVYVAKLDSEKQLVTGIVLEPDTVDAHQDTINAEAIERAAHNFLTKYNRGTKLGFLHKKFGKIGLDLVESWITPVNMKIGNQKIKRGTWLMTVHVRSKDIWEKIKTGQITGLSIGGVAKVI